jgi:Protein of unknown function (DUF3617)
MRKLLVVPLLIPLAAAADPAPFQEGKWEVTSQVTAVPRMGPLSFTQCITKKNPVPQPPGQKNCTLVEKKLAKNKLTWRLHCTGQSELEANGEVTWEGDKFHGRLVSTSTGAQTKEKLEMTYALAGRRVGPCGK